MIYSPVRKITRSHRSTIGKVPSIKNDRVHRAESSLERDFLLLLEFDKEVNAYVEQPFHIEYQLNGSSRKYTPDVFVEYNTDKLSCIYEVKYQGDLEANKEKYKDRFVAASEYADQNNYSFCIITEREIRTEYLFNIKFLLSYKRMKEVAQSEKELLLYHLKNQIISTPATLLNACTNDKVVQWELLTALWSMIATETIGCDLTRKINMSSQIWYTRPLN